jgi:hypothetical protein
MSPVEKAVRTAMRDLGKHGLKIGSLECHPETVATIVESTLVMNLINPSEVSEQVNTLPIRLCGIPVRQVV